MSTSTRSIPAVLWTVAALALLVSGCTLSSSNYDSGTYAQPADGPSRGGTTAIAVGGRQPLPEGVAAGYTPEPRVCGTPRGERVPEETPPAAEEPPAEGGPPTAGSGG